MCSSDGVRAAALCAQAVEHAAPTAAAKLPSLPPPVPPSWSVDAELRGVFPARLLVESGHGLRADQRRPVLGPAHLQFRLGLRALSDMRAACTRPPPAAPRSGRQRRPAHSAATTLDAVPPLICPMFRVCRASGPPAPAPSPSPYQLGRRAHGQLAVDAGVRRDAERLHLVGRHALPERLHAAVRRHGSGTSTAAARRALSSIRLVATSASPISSSHVTSISTAAARRAAALAEPGQRLDHQRDSGLHVVDARAVGASVLDAQRGVRQRALRMHGVHVGEHDDRRELHIAPASARAGSAEAGRVECSTCAPHASRSCRIHRPAQAMSSAAPLGVSCSTYERDRASTRAIACLTMSCRGTVHDLVHSAASLPARR
jgi:hypothetical protein